jgi:hypothetical protein
MNKSTENAKVVVISDAEPDDLISIRMFLKEFVKRKVAAENIFILSTLRNSLESAQVLDKIIKPIYPTLFSHVGSSSTKKPFVDKSGLLITSPEKEDEKKSEENSQQSNGVDKMIKFINEAKDKFVDILLLAPAIDLSDYTTSRISPEKIRGIWSWGGLTLVKTEEEKDEKSTSLSQESKQTTSSSSQLTRSPQAVDSKQASFNWRTSPQETIHLLNWAQKNKISYTICTPAIYQTTSAWSNFSGVTEENCPVFTKKLKEDKELFLVATWIKQWNEICPEAVKKRCNIGPESLQFTPADPCCIATYLWPSEMIGASGCEKIILDDNQLVKRLTKEDELTTTSTISFINEINYKFFIDRLCEL